jgi:hypothetical protein
MLSERPQTVRADRTGCPGVASLDRHVVIVPDAPVLVLHEGIVDRALRDILEAERRLDARPEGRPAAPFGVPRPATLEVMDHSRTDRIGCWPFRIRLLLALMVPSVFLVSGCGPPGTSSPAKSAPSIDSASGKASTPDGHDSLPGELLLS